MHVSEEGNQAEEEPNDSIVNIVGLWQLSLASGSTRLVAQGLVAQYRLWHSAQPLTAELLLSWDACVLSRWACRNDFAYSAACKTLCCIVLCLTAPQSSPAAEQYHQLMQVELTATAELAQCHLRQWADIFFRPRLPHTNAAHLVDEWVGGWFANAL